MLSCFGMSSPSISTLRANNLSLFSCKPQLALSIVSEPGLKEALAGKLLISILAGVTIEQLKGWVLPTTRVVRAMPNTPCKVRILLLSLVHTKVDNYVGNIDSRGNDRCVNTPTVLGNGERPSNYSQDILVNWSLQVP